MVLNFLLTRPERLDPMVLPSVNGSSGGGGDSVMLGDKAEKNAEAKSTAAAAAAAANYLLIDMSLLSSGRSSTSTVCSLGVCAMTRPMSP